MLQNEDIKTTIEKLYTIRAIISMLSIEIEKAYNSEQKFFTKEKAIHAAELYDCFYTSYLSNFNEIIDESYWKNIDLIIYLLETRNALTLCEAKEIVDYYERTGNMASFDTIAAEAIRKNVKYQPSKIENSITNTICLVNKHNSYFKNSVIALELQNAITEKANSKSKQLADDIVQIKRFINSVR